MEYFLMATDQVRKIQVPLYLRMLTDFAYFSITGKTQGKRIEIGHFIWEGKNEYLQFDCWKVSYEVRHPESR